MSLNEIIKLVENKPFLLSKFANQDSLHIMTGEVNQVYSIAELREFTNQKAQYVFSLPFSYAHEKYKSVKKCNRPINVMKVNEVSVLDVDKITFEAPDLNIENHAYYYSDEEYKQRVSQIITNEINKGEGSNFLLSNKLTGKIKSFSPKIPIEIFLKLLNNEYGAYQTFCYFSGSNYLVGASPECHVNIENGNIRMQPISGTYRKNPNLSISEAKEDLITFLSDPKEINELFMVVDEELKMLAKICPTGGRIIGPRLREMSKVIHTEYFITGKTNVNPFDVVRELMHAATVVGSPLENAFKIGAKYNPSDQGYFASLIGLYDGNNRSLDSSILIRTIEISQNGNFEICAGASIVKDSVPENELLEVKAKLGKMLANLQSNDEKSRQILPYLLFDHDIQETLYSRNKKLSKFWMFEQESLVQKGFFGNKKAIIIDNEDDFVNMLGHILEKMGIEVEIIKWHSYHTKNADITIIGPGPGDPNNLEDSKISALHNITKKLMDGQRPLLGICLGHQIISKVLGFEVRKGEKISQGEQKNIDFFGRSEVVGMYNTFFAINNGHIPDFNLSTDENNQIFAIKDKNLASTQFHPESLLTINGFEIVFDLISFLLK